MEGRNGVENDHGARVYSSPSSPLPLPPVPTSSTLASDLLALREARGLTIEQLQQRTRVPTDIIRRLESGTLLDDDRYSEVYLKAFLKSYAEAVDVPSGAVTTAIAEAKRGTYSGSLRQFLPEGAAPAPPPVPEDVAPVDDVDERAATPRESLSASGSAADAIARAPKKAKPTNDPSRVAARAPTRRDRGRRTSKPIDKSWGAILGIAAGALAVIAVVLFFLFRDDTPEDQALVPVVPDTTQVAERPDPVEQDETPQRAAAPQLQLPIRVTLLAQEPLAGFRVTEAPDIRRPYWLEAGAEQTFESAEELVIWGGERGTGYGLMDGVRLRMQGIEWAPANGVIRITPANGQAMLDSLQNLPARGAAAPPAPAPTAAGQPATPAG